MALAQYYLAKFDYCQALRYCELAQYRCQPYTINLALVHERFADIFSGMGREDEAILHLQTSINIQLQLTNRSNICLARSYRNIGITYGSKGELDEALRCFAQVGDLAPNDLTLMANSHLATANIYLELKQFDKVLEYLDLAKNVSDKIVPCRRIYIAERLRTIGILYFRKGNFNIALENLTNAIAIYEEESLKLHPTIRDTYLQLGLTLEKLNKIDEALEVFEKVKTISLVIYPKNHYLIAPCYHRISIILRDKNLLEEALKNAEDALTAAITAQRTNYNELSRIHDTLSSIHLKLGDINRARIEVQNGSAVRRTHCPEDLPLSQINLANIYIHEDCAQEANDLLNGITNDQLLSVHKYSPARLSKDIAVIYNNLKQYESALRMIKFALHHLADDEHYLGANAHFLAANICWKLDHKSQTLEHLNKALIMLDDTSNDGYRDMIIHIFKNMIKIYKSLNEYQQALECYQKMLNFCKTDEHAQIHLDIGICYEELDKMELSLQSFQLAHSLCSSIDYQLLTSIHYQLGRCYIRHGNSTKALKHFETTLDMRLLCIKPDDSLLDSLYQDMGQLYLDTEKYQEAAKFFEQLVERQLQQEDHENAVNTLVLLGLTQVRQENMSKGIYYYELGLQLCLKMNSPDYKIAAYIYSHIGEACDLDCNVWKCAESYEKAVEMASMVEPHDDELLALFLENVQVARQHVAHIEKKIIELEETETKEDN
jgi:tetratricopeptide (TPR) repeat protein